jgi:phosphatidylserine/phosphatidylglycerophosphate/cardiolipin synthase-like enzyme
MKTEAIFDNIANRIEDYINHAENSIFVAVAWLTNKNLFKALCKKASNGVKVIIITSDNEENRKSNINYRDIQIGKSQLYWIENDKMHHKFCIIDGYVVITGSYNWSYKAENNDENIVICSGNTDLVNQYKKEVKRIIENYLFEDTSSSNSKISKSFGQNTKPENSRGVNFEHGVIKPFVPVKPVTGRRTK